MNTLAARRIVNWLLGLICALAAIGAMAQARPQLIATEGHAATVSALAYSPDGHFYVSGSWDATLRVWHTDTGRLLKKIEAGCGAIYSIAFSPDGAKLAIGCADGSIRLLRAAAWQEEAVLSGHRGTVLSVSFDFSGIQLISGSRDHTVRLWGIPSGKETRVFRDHTDTVTSVTFSPDGLRAASSSTDGTIQVYDLKNKFEPARELRAKREVTAVRFNADGSQLISSGGKYNYGLGGRDEYGEVRIWNAVTGKVIHTQHFDSIVRALTVDPQSGLVYFCISYGARVLDLSNLPRFEWEMKTFEDGGRHAYALAIAPKRGLLAVGAGDSVSQWDVATKMRKKQLLDVLPKTSRAKTSYHSGTQRTAIPVGNEVVLVSTKSNQRSILLSGHTDAIADLAFSPTGKILATASLDGTVRLWDADNGDRLWTLVGHKNWVTSVVFHPNEKTVAGAGTKAILIWNVPERLTEKTSVRSILDAERVIPSWLLRDVEMERRLPASNALTIDIFNPKLRFGPSGDLLAVAGERSGGREYVTELWNVSEGALIQAWKLGASNVRGFAFAPDGATLALLMGAEIRVLDVARGAILDALRHPDMPSLRAWFTKNEEKEPFLFTAIAHSHDGKLLAASTLNKDVIFWELARRAGPLLLRGHNSLVGDVAFSDDGRFVISIAADGREVKFWDVQTGTERATLRPYFDRTWVVTDPEGRFDTADLESMPHLHWVMPDDPVTPVPLEVFMKDYYTPRLLARIMAGETFPPVRPLMTLNRTQPEVKITSVVPNASDRSLVNVTVTASGATKNYLLGEGASSKEVSRPTAAHDLRLFRDGQVVGYADGKLAEFKGNAFSKTFTVRLPQAKAGQDVVFSAYAFNDSGVKSETARTTFTAPPFQQTSPSKGAAYVITIGVNQHENRAWNLNFAANDARAVAARVAADLRKSNRYREVIPVTLTADGPTQANWQASKAAIRAVTARLSGAASGPLPEVLRGVAGAEALRRATPDDTLIISFSGHGFTDEQGMFYLMPQDTGAGQGKAVTPLLRSRSISSDELSLWLRDVDAGDMTMIVDACQSAASIASDGFKPGPMGSRGLGQLSFDKGMRILAASQSDQYALEDGKLQHGLLTFSLINDGLDAFNADHEPKDKTIYLDEWLKYGVKRVPTLWEEVKTGKVVVVNRAAQPIVLNAEGDAVASNHPARQHAQTPALFDFAKRRQGIELARAGDAK